MVALPNGRQAVILGAAVCAIFLSAYMVSPVDAGAPKRTASISVSPDTIPIFGSTKLSLCAGQTPIQVTSAHAVYYGIVSYSDYHPTIAPGKCAEWSVPGDFPFTPTQFEGKYHILIDTTTDDIFGYNVSPDYATTIDVVAQ